MTNEVTFELELTLPERLHDLLIAELDAGGFTGFVQDGELLKAYVPFCTWNPDLKLQLEDWLRKNVGSTVWEEKEIAPQDWNRMWKASIQPVKIPPFYVRPSWADPVEGLLEIVVDPKMSFGTGHHETTRLLLKLMPAFVKPGDRVLDAGTGTAILSIAAIKLKAASVLAFDVDPWVTDNVQENLNLNNVSHLITYREGAIDVIPETGFDVILANINRNVLLQYLRYFAGKIVKNGRLLLSGILLEDQPMMEEAAEKLGFKLVADDYEGSWWAGVFQRK